MALVQIGCSTSNPADGTNFTGTTGLSIVTAGSGVRTWKASVASQANTGIQITSGTTSEAVRTTAFTANLSAAWTDVLTTPAAAPSGSLNMLAVYSTSAAIFRIQWATDGRLFFYDNGGVARVIATAGTLALGTRYNFQMWFTIGTSSTTGIMHIVVTNLAGTVVATYDNTAANLGTVGASYFYIDTGGIAATYGHSEMQYNDGATSFISPYTAPTNIALTSAGTGTPTGTAAISNATTYTAAGTTTGTGTAALSPSVTFPAAGNGSPLGTASITPAVTQPAAGNGAPNSGGTVTITSTVHVAGDGVPAGTATVSSQTALPANAAGAPTGTANLATATTYAATGSGTPTGTVILGYVEYLAATGTGNSTGAATLQVNPAITAAGMPAHQGSGTRTIVTLYAAEGDGYATSANKVKLFQPGRDITATATLQSRAWAGTLGGRTRTGTLNRSRWGAHLG